MSLRETGERSEKLTPAWSPSGVEVAGGEEGCGSVVCSSPPGEDGDATGWNLVEDLC